MSSPDDDLLTATEGVDEGSAASTTEGESDPAPPQTLETDESREAQGTASGQQLEAGEG